MKTKCCGKWGIAYAVTVWTLLPAWSPVLADDWPQWRGPHRDGVWGETGIIEEFQAGNAQTVWRVPLSSGYSGPTVAAERVYVVDRVTEPEQVERVLCFDAMKGEKVWSHTYGCDYQNLPYPAGPRASVTISEGRAYALGSMGHFICLDAVSGQVLWRKDLNAEYAIRMPTWGIAASPLIEKELVIVQIGGEEKACIVAFDRTTGQEEWRALEDPVNYSSPIVIDQANKRVLVSWTTKRVVGLDPRNGQLLWEQPFTAEMGIATPVVDNGLLFVSSFFDGALLLRLHDDRPGASVAWQTKGDDSLHCCISTPILQDDCIYGVHSYGELRCFDLKTGNLVWESLAAVPRARWANIHMVRHGQHVWMFNERGELILGRLSPGGFQEVGRKALIKPTQVQLPQRGGVCWAHPAFAYKHVYLRNDEELICVDLSGE